MELSVNNHRLNGNGIIWAITASILAHVLVAVVVPNFHFSIKPEKPPVLKIELQKAEPPPPVVEPLPPVEIPEPPKPKPKPIKKKPKPTVKPKPIPKPIEPLPVVEPEVVQPIIAPEPVVEKIVAVQPSAEKAPEVIVPPAPVEPPPPPPPPGPSQADINNAKNAYSNLLGRAFAKHKSYPKIAQRRGWQGTVLLDIKIDSQGNVISTSIRESSGHAALDKKALAIAKKASPFPAPPAALKDSSFNISVPVSFKLANG